MILTSSVPGVILKAEHNKYKRRKIEIRHAHMVLMENAWKRSEMKS